MSEILAEEISGLGVPVDVTVHPATAEADGCPFPHTKTSLGFGFWQGEAVYVGPNTGCILTACGAPGDQVRDHLLRLRKLDERIETSARTVNTSAAWPCGDAVNENAVDSVRHGVDMARLKAAVDREFHNSSIHTVMMWQRRVG